jgi:hypothetical protein
MVLVEPDFEHRKSRHFDQSDGRYIRDGPNPARSLARELSLCTAHLFLTGDVVKNRYGRLAWGIADQVRGAAQDKDTHL